jgi:hypothetical protein
LGADIDVDLGFCGGEVWGWGEMGLLMLFFYCMIGRAAIDIFAIDTDAHGFWILDFGFWIQSQHLWCRVEFFNAKGAEVFLCMCGSTSVYREGRGGGMIVVGGNFLLI